MPAEQRPVGRLADHHHDRQPGLDQHVRVHRVRNPAWVISAASVDNLFPGAPAAVFGNAPPVVIWEPGAGVNVVTITNMYGTPG